MKTSRELDPEPIWYLKGLPYYRYLQTNHWRIRRDRYIETRRTRISGVLLPLSCDNCHLSAIDEITVETTKHVDPVTGQECSPRKKGAQQITSRGTERRPPWFDVHHLTYEHLGDEPDEDLILVCAPCHNAIHYPDSAAGQWWIHYRLDPLEQERILSQRTKPPSIDDRDDAWFQDVYAELES